MAKTFEIIPKTVTLTFDGTDYDGLEVVCRASASVQRVLMVQKLGAAIQGVNVEDISDVADALRGFGDSFLVSWNLQSGGEPIPANGEGLLSVDEPMLMLAILEEWGKALTVPAPLAAPSPVLAT